MAKQQKTRDRTTAKRLMWEYYRDNKDSLPKWIREHRETILELLGRGEDPERAFRMAVSGEDLAEAA